MIFIVIYLFQKQAVEGVTGQLVAKGPQDFYLTGFDEGVDVSTCGGDLWANARKPQRDYNFWAECKMGPSYHGNHNRSIPVQLDADYGFPYFDNLKYQPDFDYSRLF